MLSVAAAGVAGIVALAPLPLASNLPSAWIGWAFVTGVLAILVGRSAVFGSRVHAFPTQLFLPALLFVVMLLLIVAQVLPIATTFTSATGLEVRGTLSLAPGASQLALLRWLTYGTLFLVAVQSTQDDRESRALVWAVPLVAFVYAMVGIYSLVDGDTILGMSKWTYAGSMTSTFVNRNSFATFLAFGLTAGAALLMDELRTLRGDLGAQWWLSPLAARAMLLLAVLVVLAGCLVATQSRMGMVAGLSGTFTVILASAFHGRVNPRLLALVAVGLAIIFGVMVVAVGEGLLSRIGALDVSAEDRTALYTQTWQMILARPLLGYGAGTFEVAYPLFHAPPVPADLLWDKAHSTYLALWAELGLVVGSLPLVIVGILACQSVLLIAKRRGSGLTPIVALGCIVVAALHSIVDFSLEMHANAILFVVVLGMVPGTAIRYGRQDQLYGK